MTKTSSVGPAPTPRAPRTGILASGLVNQLLTRFDKQLVGGAITILKNMSQWEGLSIHIMEKQHVPNQQPAIINHC